jgi:flagellar biosynthesis protein FlhG
VKEHKRLGKGLQDVSHLFLSTQEEEQSPSEKDSRPRPRSQTTPEGQYPRVVAITGDRRGLEKSFLVCNVAVELARRNRQVRVLDADLSFPDQPFLWGLRSGESAARLAAVEEQGQVPQVILQGPLGIKMMSLDIDFSQLRSLAESARRRLLLGLMAFEAGAQLMLVDTPANLSLNSRLIFQLAHQIVVLVPSDSLGMVDSYSIIKGILAMRPKASVGMVTYRIRMVTEAQAIAQRMTQTVEEFLGAKITNLGYLYADLNIAKSIAQRSPLALSSLTSRAVRCLSRIADKIWMQKNAEALDESGSFFAAMNQALENRP